jgi:hypothetical protein
MISRLCALLLAVVVSASLSSDRARGSVWGGEGRAAETELLDAARIEHLLDQAVKVYRTSGREIPHEFWRPVTVASFDFPACLEPLVTNRQHIRSAMIELMQQPERLSPDQQLVAEWCWRFIYDSKAEIIVNHFQTADGLAFCGVNVTYEHGRRRQSKFGLQAPP